TPSIHTLSLHDALPILGVAYLLAAIVLLIRDANFFIDCTNFLFGVASGVAFPVTLLPGAFQVVALLLPTTYAMDLLRQYAIGARSEEHTSALQSRGHLV